MADHVDSSKRSLIMAAVSSRNTAPEMLVRSIVHGLGYRYRLHARDLPGSPDLVFPARRKVIFVHGCFWHRHPNCKYASTPKTRTGFWQAKFDANVARDRRTFRQLRKLGWSVLTVWQCRIKHRDRLVKRLDDFLAN